MAHVSQKKKDTVTHLTKDMKGYSVVGIADLFGVPASQLQQIREKLRNDMKIFMAKKNLMKIVLNNLEEGMNGISKLADSFDGMPCLVLSKDTPFKLAKLLAQNKTSAPAKAGQKAPNDIYIRAGPTPFSPGPVIGELGALGIKSGVENGKIAIKVDKLLVKSGAVINEQQASILGRLGITPMEIGISLAIAYENGDFYSREVLAVDASQYLSRLQAASREALALTVELGLIMPENINFLLQKANAQAKKLETLKDANQLNTGIQEG